MHVLTILPDRDLHDALLHLTTRCIGPQWPMTQMANGHLGLDLNGQWFTFETSDVTWSQKSTT